MSRMMDPTKPWAVVLVMDATHMPPWWVRFALRHARGSMPITLLPGDAIQVTDQVKEVRTITFGLSDSERAALAAAPDNEP